MKEHLPEYSNEKRRFSLSQNGLGYYWPIYEVKANDWCPIIIRNSNPFKTRKAAIKFIESFISKRGLNND